MKVYGLTGGVGMGKSTSDKLLRERGLAVWAFYAWKKRVREAEAAKFVEVAVKPVKPGCRSSAGDAKTIEIRLRSGLSLFVGPGFEASHLHALLSELER